MRDNGGGVIVNIASTRADHLQHPASRVGRPEDVARACLYLSEEGNDFVTGINLVLDGGLTRKMITKNDSKTKVSAPPSP